MNQEYFSVALSPDLNLAIPLDSMGRVIQVEINDICTIPGVADFWYGAIAFKGSLLWVLDSDRYFNLGNQKQRHQKKITAVIVKEQQGESSARVALTTPKLEGIIALEPVSAKQLDREPESTLNMCCSGSIEDKARHTFILNPSKLLQQLHQTSDLVSA
ncbi:MAG: chemotaxis protein CheW [Cyanobacteria bacterium P01_G01_bin.19]